MARIDDATDGLHDRDFGEKVYRDHYRHFGVILLRLSDERTPAKIDVLARLLEQYGERIQHSFVVATEEHVRFGAHR